MNNCAIGQRWIGIAIFAGLVPILWGTGSAGRIVEFSPQTLRARESWEWSILWGSVSVLRLPSFEKDLPLVRFAESEGMIKPQVDGNPHWLRVYHFNDAWRDGYTPLFALVRTVDAKIAWMKQNRTAAAHLWGEIFTRLRSKDEEEIRIGIEMTHVLDALPARCTISEIDALLRCHIRSAKDCASAPIAP